MYAFGLGVVPGVYFTRLVVFLNYIVRAPLPVPLGQMGVHPNFSLDSLTEVYCFLTVLRCPFLYFPSYTRAVISSKYSDQFPALKGLPVLLDIFVIKSLCD